MILELLPKLKHCSKWCFDADLINQCDLISAWCYLVIGETVKFKKLMDSLSERIDEFTHEHLYRYYFCLGAFEYSLLNYKQALQMYLKATEINFQITQREGSS